MAESSQRSTFQKWLPFWLTPILMFLIIGGILAAVLSFPFSKIKTYSEFIFSKNTTDISELGSISDYRSSNAPDIVSNKEDTLGHTIIYPYYGDIYAVLNCPNAGLSDVPIFWGTDSEILNKGAGQYTGSVYFGLEGNSVVCGHNNTFFYNLQNCKEGDIVEIVTSYGKFTYQVSEIVHFKENDRTYVNPTEDERLTLYTCWTDGMPGISDERIGYICEVIEKKFYD